MTCAWDPVRRRMVYLHPRFSPMSMIVEQIERQGCDRLARRAFEKHPEVATWLRECAG